MDMDLQIEGIKLQTNADGTLHLLWLAKYPK